jgi:hypothetical protein
MSSNLRSHPQKPFINTGASARWKDVLWLTQLFQQFATQPGKQLKQLKSRRTTLHRAEAPMLMIINGAL